MKGKYMKQIRIQLLCLFLTLAATLSAVGCGGKKENKPDDTGTKQTAASGERDLTVENWVPARDWSEDGAPRQVILLTFSQYNDNYHFISYDETNEALNIEAYKRTAYINSLFGVDLQCVEDNHLQQTLSNSVFGGGGEYDLFYPHPSSELPSMVVGGMMTELAGQQDMNLGQRWWNQSQVNNYTVNGKLYLAVSDFSLSGQGFTCILFNRDIWRRLEFEDKPDLYDLVDSGNWTAERLATYTRLYGLDNGDGVYDSSDTYGLVYQDQQSTAFLYGYGETIVKVDSANGGYELGLSPMKMNGIAEKLKTLVYDSDNHVFHGACNYGTFEQSEMWDVFRNGRALFMTYDVGALYRYLLGAKQDVGYLPIPKYDGNQDNYNVLCAAGFLAIPKLAADTEMSAILLEALAIHSYLNYRPAFINNILLGRLSEESNDYRMLEFLHDRKTYDIGYTFDIEGVAVDLLMVVAINKKSTNVSGYLTGRQTQLNRILENINSLAQTDTK